MVDQTTMNGTSSRPGGVTPRGRNAASGLAHDLVTLVELQSQLLSIDARQGLRSATLPLILMVGGAVVGLACLPIGLAAAALGLAQASGLHVASALGIIFAAALAVAAIMLLSGLNRTRRLSATFDRSRYEWQRNVQWLKQTLRNQDNSEEGAR